MCQVSLVIKYKLLKSIWLIYALVANNAEHDKLSHFRVDRLTETIDTYYLPFGQGLLTIML